jgi:uncharacterized protein
MQNKKHTNDLIREKSPYLLQHAHNPVHWKAWNEATLKEAKASGKLLLISVGYSACHWCHVMEHESFEDEAVAEVMNKHFTCIKVDREERPDVDQVYMGAVQLMTGQGGWPLNCFALPDGRPVYGGTYFPKKQWVNILENLADMYIHDTEKVLRYATELTAGISKMDAPIIDQAFELDKNILDTAVENWKGILDYDYGGQAKAPKFPLPNNYLFLLRHAFFTKDEQIKQQVKLTLQEMAYGGIYDQIGGGFARYSVDTVWKVPHFEKMLYDNAQLLSLYSEAYQFFKDDFYKQVINEIIQFLETDFLTSEGAYCSALDADSQGVEGKYYVWTKDELQAIIGKDDFNLFSQYYNINEKGYWEDENYILLRSKSDKKIAVENSLTLESLQEKVSAWKTKLLAERVKRIAPGKDDKILTSWNALTIKGLVDAYKATQNNHYLQLAMQCGDFIMKKVLHDEVKLFHAYKAGEAYIQGFLEDYAFVIDAFIALYEVSGEEQWLNKALDICNNTMVSFYDADTYSFYFTEASQNDLIVRKRELNDNVIPASNSAMAKNLLVLSYYFGIPEWKEIAMKMCLKFTEEMKSYLGGYSNYALVLQHYIYPTNEVAIVGKAVDEKTAFFHNAYLPNCIFALCKTAETTIPLCKDRYVEGKTLIYVCENNACKMPTEETAMALDMLHV